MKNKKKKLNKITLLSFIVFLSLFIFGINANEPQRVLEQSWNICLECIGIG
ncbi:MAG: CD1871A family CXXC motif-containing protein [Thermodesulfobacteriota bacterium]|nr:CD1871A family CXXC motif-containing protein [Thermodesulfobacteriota bacterium]